MSKFSAAIKLGGTVLFLGICTVLLLLTIPKGSWKAMSVQTGSMRPAINPGDMVLVKRVPVTSLRVGDVITYINPQNQKQTITHRIVALNGPQLIVKGDANKGPDPVVSSNMVVGKVNKSIPYLGHGVDFVRTPLGLLTLIYVPALIVVISEIRRLAKHYKSREVYMLPEIALRLRKTRSAFRRKLSLASKLTLVLCISALAVAWPVKALLTSNEVTLVNNTISATGALPTQCPPGGNTNNTNISVTGNGTNNNNTVVVNNSNNQSANSGDATVSGNTNGGNATSGDATNTNCTNININITNNP